MGRVSTRDNVIGHGNGLPWFCHHLKTYLFRIRCNRSFHVIILLLKLIECILCSACVDGSRVGDCGERS